MVLQTIVHTVESPNPKSAAMIYIQYLLLVARWSQRPAYQQQQANDTLSLSSLCEVHSTPKVALLILRLSYHHSSPNTPALAAFQYTCERGLHQTLRSPRLVLNGISYIYFIKQNKYYKSLFY